MDDEDEKLECDNCGYQTETKEYSTGSPKRTYHYCEICASSGLSKATSWPEQVEDTRLYKALAYCTNLILDEVRKSKKDQPKNSPQIIILKCPRCGSGEVHFSPANPRRYYCAHCGFDGVRDMFREDK